MGDLQRRMHAGVGAPGRMYTRRLRGNFRHGALNAILYAAAVGLRLPTVKVAAVVFESERNVHCESSPVLHREAGRRGKGQLPGKILYQIALRLNSPSCIDSRDREFMKDQ
jgi:hypothetical protein